MKNLENKYIKLANECADVSGKIIKKYFRKNIKIRFKTDNTHVTTADNEAEEKIRDLILKKAPERAERDPKYLNANAVASPEFCIPISIAIVLDIFLS